MLNRLAALPAFALIACGGMFAQEPGSGLTLLASAEDGVAGQIAFTLDYDGGPEPLQPHRGFRDPQGFDYPLEPGRPVTVRVAYAEGDRELAALAVPLQPRNDFTYSVHAHAGRDDPTAMCMGCMGLQSAPLDPAAPGVRACGSTPASTASASQSCSDRVTQATPCQPQ